MKLYSIWYLHNNYLKTEEQLVSFAEQEGYYVARPELAVKILDHWGDISVRSTISFLSDKYPENITLGEN